MVEITGDEEKANNILEGFKNSMPDAQPFTQYYLQPLMSSCFYCSCQKW